jgi:hypothetical protein
LPPIVAKWSITAENQKYSLDIGTGHSSTGGFVTSWNIQGTFREHSRNVQGTFKERSGTFRERSGNIQGTFFPEHIMANLSFHEKIINPAHRRR